MLVQPVNNGASSQPPTCKCCFKAEIADDVQCAAEEKDTAQEAEHAVNQQLAELEAPHSYDTDLPTPHPLSLSQLGTSMTLRGSSS